MEITDFEDFVNYAINEFEFDKQEFLFMLANRTYENDRFIELVTKFYLDKPDKLDLFREYLWEATSKLKLDIFLITFTRKISF